MTRISAAVGQGAVNRKPDVRLVQNLINEHIRSIAPTPALVVDGLIGSKTISAIRVFQRKVVRLNSPDGRVDPGGKTITALAKPPGAVPRVHYPAGPQEPLADIARPYIGATEARGNRMGSDPRMREIYEADHLAPGGQTDGYPWCCSFVSMCVQKLIDQSAFYQQVRPPTTASVSNFRTRWAPAQNCLIFRPKDQIHQPHKGDIVIFTFSHIGIVDELAASMVWTIEGNTNETKGREGTTVLRNSREFSIIRCFIRLPIPANYDIAKLLCVA